MTCLGKVAEDVFPGEVARAIVAVLGVPLVVYIILSNASYMYIFRLLPTVIEVLQHTGRFIISNDDFYELWHMYTPSSIQTYHGSGSAFLKASLPAFKLSN